MKGTIRARGRDTWQLVYDLPAGADGKRRQKTETVRGPKKSAQIRLREVLGAVDQGRVADPGKMTVGQYLDEWYGVTTGSRGTLRRHESIIRLYIKPSIGHIRLTNLTALHIEGMYQGEKMKALSASSVRQTHVTLGKALGRAVKLGLILRNPCRDIESLPKNSKHAVRFLATAKETRYLPIIMAALCTGMRLGELRGLSWEDVDLDAGIIRVRRSADRFNEITETLKTPKSRRTIAIPAALVDALKKHHQHLLEEKMRLRPIWKDLNLVFPRPDGGVMGICVMQKPFMLMCEKAEVTVSFHSLRHTHASDLIAANIHPKVISERLGHSNISTTMDRYGHLFPGAQDAAAAAIDAAIREAM
jgi:integrase